MSELNTRTKLRGWTVNQMRDCIVEAVDLFSVISKEYDMRFAKVFLSKWKLEEEE